MYLSSFINQSNSILTHYLLESFKYLGYLLLTGTIMNLIGMGKLFEVTLEVMGKLTGYAIGLVLFIMYRFIIKPVYNKLFIKKVTINQSRH